MSKKSEKKLTFDVRQRIASEAAREVLEEKVATMKAEMLAMKAAAAPVAAPAVAIVPPAAVGPTRAEVRANVLQRARAARDPLEQAQIILAGAFSLSSDEDQDREYALRGRPPPEAA